MQPVDTLIAPRWVVPVEPAGVLEHHAVVIDRGRLAAVLPASEALARFDARERIDLPDHVVIPGLVNLHTHAAMSLLRGFADDLALMRWLKDRIWPAEARYADSRFVVDGTRLACAEMLRGGITCFNDMYFYPESAAEAALALGMRAAIGIIAVEFPTAYASDADDYLTKGLAVRDRYAGEALLSFCMAPHAPYTVSDRTLSRIVTFAEQLGVPIHTHLHETADEVHQSQVRFGMRPIERLRRLGLLSPALIGVHCVHLEKEEIDLLAAHGCHVAHCPTSNMKLASGIAPIARAEAAGVEVGLGTDGAASNNRLDMFREMRHAALLAKVSSGDAAVLPAHQVLRMATLGGATALGLDADIGSLQMGKRADLCAVRLSDLELSPCFDPVSHLVYVAGREHVTDVWVEGCHRVRSGELWYADNTQLLALVRVWQNRIMSSQNP